MLSKVLSETKGREAILTPAQWRVYCALRYDGADDLTIAARLGISPNTVKTHLQRVYEKAGVSTRAALLAAELNGEVRFTRRGATLNLN